MSNGIGLSPDETAVLIQWMRDKETQKAAIAALKTNTDDVSRDHFLRALFDLWMENGARGSERWAFVCTAAGGDACAASLGPACRKWAKNCDRVRANEAIDRLAGIGTPAALMELSRTSATSVRASVQQRAAAALEKAAELNGWTMDQLEDRIVPACGLSPDGTKAFDFGPRSFHICFGRGLDVRLKDSSGSVRDALPKPARTDDRIMAASALAEWKTMKKQLPGVLRHEAARLELAMGGQRYWSAADFAQCLLAHPVLFQLARRLVWSAFDEYGTRTGQLRVSEDRSLATVEDSTFRAAADFVSVTHPLMLDSAERDQWAAVFSDYQIIQPFDQLTRLFFRLSGEELEASAITRFQGMLIDSLSDGLKQLGWHALASHEWLVKTWPAAGVTAMTTLEPTGLRYPGMSLIGPQEVLKIIAVSEWITKEDPAEEQSVSPQELADGSLGFETVAQDFFALNPPLPLHSVPATVLSDIIRDFEVIRLRRLANPPAPA